MARGDDPAAFDARRGGDAAFAVCHDEHAVPAAAVLGIVGDAGGGVEVGAAAADSFEVWVGALFPFEGVLDVGIAVEGKDGDGDLLGQGAEFVEEEGELGVVDGA